MANQIEQFLKSIPAWENKKISMVEGPPSVVSPIHRAVESHCRIISIGEGQDLQKFFLKVRHDDMKDFFNEAEIIANSKIASEAKVSPNLYFSNPDIGVMIYELLGEDWHWGKVDDFSQSNILENVLKAKKNLRNGERFVNDVDVFEIIKSYLAIISKEKLQVPADVPDVALKVAEIGEAIKASGIEKKPCHGDGVASNIMINSNNSVKLVDFDRSGNMDPYYDLASLMVEAFQFPEDERKMLEMAGESSEFAYNRCKCYSIVDDFLWALWGFICFHYSRREEVEFVKYAEWRILRARWNLSNKNFSYWLGHLD